MTTSVAKYDRLEDLEDHVVDYLASVTDLDVFGCTLDFVHPTMQTYLEDPIWEVLQTNTQFTIVLRDCLAFLHSKESFDGCPYRDIPQAVKFQQTWQESFPRVLLSLCHAMSVSKQAQTQLELKPGKAADIFEWSGCPVLWCDLRITPSEGANCSTASQHQAV